MFRGITAWYQSYQQKKKLQRLELIRKWDEIALDCITANEKLENLFDGTKYIDQQLN